MADKPQGSSAPGINTPTQDRRITDLILEVMTSFAGGKPGRLNADPFRVGVNASQSGDRPSPINLGVVVHAIPHLNWYKVQSTDAGGFVGCCMLRQYGAIPMGVHSGSPIPPNSTVIFVKPPHWNFGVILGVLPPILQTGSISRPDWLVQGGHSGIKKEAAHRQPLTGTVRAGGVLDFSGGSPLDATSLEASLMTETGLAFLLDPFQAYLRVNEMCGLFLSYFDSYTRLCGLSMDVFTAMHEESFKLDEGEHTYFRGESTYPWESMGTFTPGGNASFDEFDDKAVQIDRSVGKLDLPVDKRGIRPFHRKREYGGYLGQGGVRLIVAPPNDSGFNAGNDEGAKDSPGLFCESVGLDGQWTVQTAKGILFVKKLNVVAPRLTNEAESLTGDHKGDGNYKFSSFYGTGSSHKVGDLGTIATSGVSVLKVAGINDMIAHLTNWKVLHPFHYHTRDYRVPEEKDASGGAFPGNTESLAFGSLESNNYLLDPQPLRLNIDHRYNQVDYYQRMSFFSMGDDGNIDIGCGAGSRICMVNGKIRIEAPGDIEIVAGNRVVTLSRDLILRACNSADITASNGDMRLAAKNNFQATGKGMLFDAKGAERVYEYTNRVGEQVVSNGIVFRSAGDLSLLSDDIYIRSGATLGSKRGGILLDAARRLGSIIMEAVEISGTTAEGTTFNVGNVGENPTHVHSFGPDATVLSSPLVAVGNATIKGSLTVSGTASVDGDIQCTQRLATADGGLSAKLPDNLRQRIRTTATAADITYLTTLATGNDVTEKFFERDWRAGNAPGSETMRRDMLFSFRDDDANAQYGTADLRFLEPRWQQMVRLGAATGGTKWVEPGLEYQGKTLYPWPGRSAWLTRKTFVRTDTPTLYDAATGNAATRSEATYGDAEYAGLDNVSMSDGLKVIF